MTKPTNNDTGAINVKRYCLNILCVLKYVQYWLKNGNTLPLLARLKIVNLLHINKKIYHEKAVTASPVLIADCFSLAYSSLETLTIGTWG